MPYRDCPTCGGKGQVYASDAPLTARQRYLAESWYAANKRIRLLAGTGPTPEWRALLDECDRARSALEAAGGRC